MRADRPHFDATVSRRATVTPHMLRLTLSLLPADKPFAATTRPDEFFGLWVPTPDGDTAKRYYSVRAWRPAAGDAGAGELDVDVVVHAAGPVTTWAREAAIGSRCSFDQPRGHYAPPAGTELVIVAGDATALPAIGRILDERVDAPGAPRVLVLVTVDDAADRQVFPLRPGDEVRWLAPTALVPATIAAATDAPDASYLWFSGEASDMRDVRRHLRHGLHWPTDRWMTMGYWRRDEERWSAEFDRHPALATQLAAIWESDEDSEEQRDRSDELLARYGL